MNLVSTAIGYPYIGEQREWKKTLEAFWSDAITESQFLGEMKELRLELLKKQQSLGLDYSTVGDFTLYDRMLDHAAMFGLIPTRYEWAGREVDLQTYYAMARGAKSIVACEMTKWFNTNYHYIVPEYENQKLQLTKNYILEYFNRSERGIRYRHKTYVNWTFYICPTSKGI